MKRDYELLTRILKVVEAATYDFNETPIELDLQEYTEDEVGYHVLLLHEAGLITVSSHGISDDGRIRPRPIRMTWQGHEYLERNREAMAKE